mgnify:CR=1 FL=1
MDKLRMAASTCVASPDASSGRLHSIKLAMPQALSVQSAAAIEKAASAEGGIAGLALASGQAAVTYAVLTIADDGHIEGEVRAPVVVISGRMTGDIHAGERIELAANARVNGNIHYKVVEMAAGAMITGRLIHADAPLAQLTGPDTAPAGGRAKNKAEAQEA